MSFSSQSGPSARGPAAGVMGEINMTPMVDVMLVLLVIFIVTVPVLQHAVKVDLPRASSQPEAPEAQPLTLTVDAQGAYFLDATPLPAQDLEAALRRHAEQDPQRHLSLRGDRQVPYEHVARAMAAAQRAGLSRVAFVALEGQP